MSRPKQRFSPRATLYSPPPSQTSKAPRGRDAAVAGIEAQHDLAQADQVPPAVFFRSNFQGHRLSLRNIQEVTDFDHLPEILYCYTQVPILRVRL